MSENDESLVEPGQGQEGYGVAPPDPEVARYRPEVLPDYADVPPPAEPDEQKERFQFSVAEMLVFTAVVALLLGIAGLFPAGYALPNLAGFLGICLGLSYLVLACFRSVRPIVRLGWCLLFAAYLLICFLAGMRE